MISIQALQDVNFASQKQLKMAIRVRKDSEGNRRPDYHPGSKPGSGGRGGSPLVYFIPMILKMFSKNPKILIILIIIGGVFMYFKKLL